MRRFLVSLLSLVFLASCAQASGRLSLHAQAGAAPGPPASQTAYWGPKTLNGNGGYDPCQGLCTLPITSAPDTANFYWDTTNLWVIPKNGGTKTYNGVRGSPLAGTEDFVLTDSGGHTITVHNVADASRAGNYTVRWRNGDNFNSASGNAQLEIALSKALPGEDIRWRKDTPGINTTNNTDTALQGKSQFRFACNLGTCAAVNHTWFNGSNWITMQPEQGGTWVWGPSTMEGLYGVHLKNITFGGADWSVCIQGSTCPYLLGGGDSVNIWVENSTFTGNPNEDCLTLASTCGKNTINAISQNTSAANWKVTGNTFNWVYNAINLPMFQGTYPADVNGTAPATSGGNSLGHLIDSNIFTNVRADIFDIACMHHSTITNNIAYDRKKGTRVGTAANAWRNPFDANSQQHADYSQNDCVGGVYEFWPDNVISNNQLWRGVGTGPIPYWDVANGVPNPNTYVGIAAPSGASVPNPNVGVTAGQGLYFSNWAGDATCTTLPLVNGCHFFNGTSVQRTYNLVLTNLTMRDNLVFTDPDRGISLPPVKDSFVTGNVVVGPVDPALPNLSDTSAAWSSGKPGLLFGDAGTPTPAVNTDVQRNIMMGNLVCNGCTLGPNKSNMVSTGGTVAVFQNPAAPNGNPTSLTTYKVGFLPILHGPAVMCTVLGVEVYAGPYRPDGSLETGTCP